MVKFIYNNRIDKSQFDVGNKTVDKKELAIPYIVFSMDAKPASFNHAIAKAFASCYRLIIKRR